MKYLTYDLYDDFTCIGGDCPDTCCASWNIPVDDSTAAYYRSLSTPFGQKLRDNLITDSQSNTLIKLHDGLCPFLTEDRLCQIYRELGEDRMCDTCTFYPRFHWTYGDLTFRGLNLSCPEFARTLLLRRDTIQFHYSEDALPSSDGATDWTLFNTLVSGMTRSIELMQNRSLCLSDRMRLLLIFNDALTQHLDEGTDCTPLFPVFAPEHADDLAARLAAVPKNHADKLSFFLNFGRNLEKFSPTTLRNLHPLLAFDSSYSADEMNHFLAQCDTPEYQMQWEQYSVYFLSCFYMEASQTRNPRKCIAVFAYLYCLGFYFSALSAAEKKHPPTIPEQAEILSKLARTFEHSGGMQFDTLYAVSEAGGFAETSALLALLC